MALGSNSSGDRTFLSVGFGKIRQKSVNGKKVDAGTVGAVCRETQSGAESWALEHDFLTGVIEKIFYKEDTNYGNSFEVIITDGLDTYQLSFTEDSRFWFDMAKKLPNVNFSEKIKITAYDFEDKQTHKRRAGISLEQNGQKISSYYDYFDEDTQSWSILHGYPNEQIDWKDKDEIKMYMIKIKKFLRSEFVRLIEPKLEAKQDVKEEPKETENAPVEVQKDEPTNDLPFN